MISGRDRHLLHHLRLEHRGGGQAEEDVGAGDDVGELPLVGLLGIDALPAVHQHRPALVDDTLDVGDPDVLPPRAERDEQVEAGERGGAGARGHDLDVLDALAGERERILHRGGDDDRGAVLIVVEHRDLHARLQAGLHLEAFRRLDVLEIDAAEGRLQRRHHVDDAVDLLGVDLDVEHVDAGELLEQHRLAFHHRLAGERADVAEPEHRGAVGHHGDEVRPRGERSGFRRIGGDGETGDRDARRVGEREIVLGRERLRRLDGELSGLRQPVIGERARLEIVGYVGGHADSSRGGAPF